MNTAAPSHDTPKVMWEHPHSTVHTDEDVELCEEKFRILLILNNWVFLYFQHIFRVFHRDISRMNRIYKANKQKWKNLKKKNAWVWAFRMLNSKQQHNDIIEAAELEAHTQRNK